MNRSSFAPVAGILAFALAFSAHAGQVVDNASQRLQNVVNNNVPQQYRPLLQDKLSDVLRDITALQNDLTRLDNVTNNNLPVANRQIVNDKIAALKAALAQELGALTPPPTPIPVPPVDRGVFCAAACVTASHVADMAYTAGARGSSRLVAQQAAADRLASKYSCNFGAVQIGCEDVGPREDAVTCQAACISVSGAADMSYAALGQGSTTLEARIKARDAIASKYSCNFGVIDVTCERR